MNYQNNQLSIGILGGTFDPIHWGHLLAADSVLDELKMDQIWFMPTHIPPHKSMSGITEAKHRIRMVELAIAPYVEYKVSTIEFERAKISYTYDTIILLRELYPSYKFHFIIGADMVEYLPNWHRYEELVDLVQFVALMRPGYVIPSDQAWIHSLKFVSMPQFDISSSKIRERLLAKKSIRFYVPDSVRLYIEENQLYVE